MIKIRIKIEIKVINNLLGIFLLSRRTSGDDDCIRSVEVVVGVDVEKRDREDDDRTMDEDDDGNDDSNADDDDNNDQSHSRNADTVTDADDGINAYDDDDNDCKDDDDNDCKDDKLRRDSGLTMTNNL